MFNFKSLMATALIAGTLVGVSAPASATVSFANFSATSSGANIRWKPSTTATLAGAAGTGGTIFTIATPSGTTAGATNVTFNFLVGGLPVAIAAKFTLLGTVLNGNPAQFLGNCKVGSPAGSCFITQPNIFGHFSFIASVNNPTYGIVAGVTNLLSATNYFGAIVSGVRTTTGGSAGFNGSDPGTGTVTYTSDLLDFTATTGRDFSITLGSINPRFTAVGTPCAVLSVTCTSFMNPNKALTAFTASANGTFGSEPSPAVPEPATWALLVAGFGMVGFQVRRRRALASVVA